MARVVARTPNNIAINGHTDASARTENPQYTNWELSPIAPTARRFLITTQLELRVQRVVGLAT